jgi:hypothetical protein
MGSGETSFRGNGEFRMSTRARVDAGDGSNTENAPIVSRRSRLRLGRTVVVSGCVAALLVVAGCSNSAKKNDAGSSSAASTSTAGPVVPSTPSSGTTKPRPSKASSHTTSHKPVPPPTSGNIHTTVPVGRVQTQTKKGLLGTQSFHNGVTVTIRSVTPIQTKATLPGEISGPGYAVVVSITNGSGKSITVNNVVVTMQDHAKTPGSPMEGAPAKPFRGTLAKGASADGTYVFAMSHSHKNPVTITVSYSADQPDLAFVGNTK